MAVNMNPESGNPINNTETTYHKRGENEGIGLQEFIHRLSVFIKAHPDYVENLSDDYYIPGGRRTYLGKSIFSTPVADATLNNASDIFNSIDEDGSGTITFEELRKSSNAVAQWVKDAYSYDLVPDNPTNVLEDENGKIDKTELTELKNGLGFNQRSDLSEILHQAKAENNKTDNK